MKLADKLKLLQRSAPKRTSYGQLYRNPADLKKRYTRVTLWTLFVSHENTHLLRDHVFNKKDPLSTAQWADWFAENLQDIHRNAILPGIAIRTNKQWAVQRIIGWIGDAEHSSNPPSVGRKRHKAKRKGRKNG